VSQSTETARRPWHVRRHDTRRLFMRTYLKVVVAIIGLLGAYVVLLPLIT
jgi:hypothetical protein